MRNVNSHRAARGLRRLFFKSRMVDYAETTALSVAEFITGSGSKLSKNEQPSVHPRLAVENRLPTSKPAKGGQISPRLVYSQTAL